MDDHTSQEATPNRGASAGNAGHFDPRDLIPTPLFCATPDGRLVWMNAAAEALTGRHAASVAGDPFSVLFPEETRMKAARHVLRQNRRGVTDYYFETPIVAAGAESHWVGLHVRRATAANGRTAYVCAAHDLHEIHANLETLARRNRELGARLEEATAGAELKSSFLAAMSSELRAPMNGVIGMTRLLLDSNLDRDQRTWAEVIQSSGNQLLDLVDDILDYSRIESGQLTIGSMDFDLRVTVDAVASLLATRAHLSGILFSSAVHHRVPSLVNGDPGRVRQVILHLASCALEQAEGGEVQLRVELVDETAHQAVLRFWVNRIGAAPGTDLANEAGLVAAFNGDPVGEGGSARLGGRGLGLTIARRLVTLMGGDAGGNRVGDIGSKLWFRVPLGKQAERPATETIAPASPHVGVDAASRVLVVDVDAAARAAVREAVASWGATCDESEGGLDAIERLKSAAGMGTPYGAALVDLDVAELDAASFAHAVRADQALSRLPLILLTGLGRPGDAARAEEWGYDAYFVTPVEGAELRSALADIAARPADAPARLITRHTVAEMKKRRVRVLVVEDNPIDQLVIASALRRVGYTPEIAPTAEEAIAAIARHAADVVFVDVASSGDEGYTRAAELRGACDAASGGGVRTPIIALVGRVRDEEKEQCRVAGIDDLLGKPVDLEVLVATVGRWVDARGEETAPVVQEVPTTIASPPPPAPPTPAAYDESVPASAEPPVAAVPPVDEPQKTPRADWIEENTPVPTPEPAAAEPVAETAFETAFERAFEPESAVAQNPNDPISALPVFDAECLEKASMGNPEIRGLLVDAFLTRTRQPLDRLRKAAEWKDLKAMGLQAHAIGGMCQSVGAVRCAAALGRVEELATSDRFDEAVAAFARVESELALVRAEWGVTTREDGEAARAA